jgi:hypothetical protein
MAGRRAGRSVLEDHPQLIELFGIRIPAFGGLCRGVDSRLNGLGALFSNRLDQAEFVSSIGLRPPESGDKVGMGKGLIHRNLIV